MADLTASVQKPGVVGVAPVYVAVSAADFFTAAPGAHYRLHYKCGATPTGAGAFKVTDPTTVIPPGSGLAAGFADLAIQSAGMTATTELICDIPNSYRHRDTAGRINLTHTGTLTTVTVAITGPYPAL